VVVDNRELIKRPGFPVPLLPVITVTNNLIQFLLALPILFAAIIIERTPLSISILLLPLIILIQFVFTVSLGYILSAFEVTYRDIQHLLAVMLMLLFYLTPVFYDSSIVPARFIFIYELNPMVHLMRAYRAILVQGAVPDLVAMLVLSALTALLLWLGLTIFTRASNRFIEEL
jgi:lipopolysaccharide transport system permease protein